ncbi:SEC14 cytosolic factor family protein / phosphoglyceride transfer family protein [Striga hermonthica]|uniref:SEC14 cytosolic factor family protein / phosphoglyceride transfer family protein n=1 Tax=Striga hermonthica TaxID=68872 RepID=A0A9N7NLQ7_STRHE|nr:SEC14 cytosolic factor family protein / phosphoglyceride transfer family protein [Striga hermonthica]
MANFVNNKNLSKGLSIASSPKSHAGQPVRPIISKNLEIGRATGGKVAVFLIKTFALEAVRRFSRAKCPFLWTGLQGLQVFCYPPLKWLQRWNPFGYLVNGMQMLSGPLLVLSIANAISEHSDCSSFRSGDAENSPGTDDSQPSSESISGCSSLQCNEGMSVGDEDLHNPSSTVWMDHLCEELENQGITLPERFNKEELHRFYAAANGDFPSLLSSVKKTIRWRETYRILSGEELEMWSNMIFWHGFDSRRRPCLIIRFGLACISLPAHDRPRFAQALVSQVELGVLQLLDGDNPQITVLVDCQGLSSLRLPMQTVRYCCNILQSHFPNVLGCLIVIRLPSVVRVIAQTFIQVLKPATKQKLRIEGQSYKKVLAECFQTIPSYLGGSCTCTRCVRLDSSSSLQQISNRQAYIRESISDLANAENFLSDQPTYQYDMTMDNSCSRTLRSAVIGVLIIWVLFAFIEGISNPETRPFLP